VTSATVTFGLTWLTNAVTAVSVTAANPVRAGSAVLGGGFRSYAGGRIRVITTSDDTRTYPIVMQSLSDSDLLLLDSWRGHVVLLRDAMGWRKWGSYVAMSWNDVPGGDGMIHDVSLTFQEISFSEAV
jgi:hypothetical protein